MMQLGPKRLGAMIAAWALCLSPLALAQESVNTYQLPPGSSDRPATSMGPLYNETATPSAKESAAPDTRARPMPTQSTATSSPPTTLTQRPVSQAPVIVPPATQRLLRQAQNATSPETPASPAPTLDPLPPQSAVALPEPSATTGPELTTESIVPVSQGSVISLPVIAGLVVLFLAVIIGFFVAARVRPRPSAPPAQDFAPPPAPSQPPRVIVDPKPAPPPADPAPKPEPEPEAVAKPEPTAVSEPAPVPIPEPITEPAEKPPLELVEEAVAGPALALAFEAEKLSRTLVYATLHYRLTVTNTGADVAGPLTIIGDLASAHSSQSTDQQLTPADDTAPLHHIASLARGESTQVSGQMRLPVNSILPIRRDDANLFVPLTRLRVIDGAGRIIAQRAFVVGQPGETPDGALRPIPIGGAPGTIRPLGQRELPVQA